MSPPKKTHNNNNIKNQAPSRGAIAPTPHWIGCFFFNITQCDMYNLY
jgi:hypothetical protein